MSMFFLLYQNEKNINPKNTKLGINTVKWKFIARNFHKIQPILNKTGIFYQTNEYESSTGAKYRFPKLLLRASLFGKTTLCINRQ